MSMNDGNITSSLELREAAERQLTSIPPIITSKRTEVLLHELHVHQIELEMQNENLRQVHAEMEKSRDHYVDLYDFSPVGYLTLSHNGLISGINLTLADLLGKERHKLVKHRFAKFVVPEDRDRWAQYFMRVLQSGDPQDCELSLVRADSSRFNVQLKAKRIEAGKNVYAVRISLTDITKLKEMEAIQLSQQQHMQEEREVARQKLEYAYTEWTNALNVVDDAIFMHDKEFRILRCNKAYQQRAGIEDLNQIIGQPYYEIFPASHVPLSCCLHALESATVAEEEINLGEESFRSRSFAIYDEQNVYLYSAHIIEDITELKKTELNISIAATVFEAQEGMMVASAKGLILKVNSAFTRITGYLPEEVIGQNPHILSSGRHDKYFYDAMWNGLNHTGYWEGEIWNKRKSGEIYPENLCITAVKNGKGVIKNYVATLTDITVSRNAADEIQHLAFYDTLTRLPNRRFLLDKLKLALASSARSGKHGAILFMDLDNFKTLNDTRGHDIGDLLLKAVAHRLESCVREGDTVARQGGDEFVIMLENLSEHELEAATQAEAVGNKILIELNRSYQLASFEYHNTPSIGATLFINHKTSIDDLLKQSDIAMYQAKKAGRNAMRFFDPEMQESINARAALENELRIAIERHQFELYYQIQVDSSGTALGAEALIRWKHPERGFVSPDQFVPLAEETGQILAIGHWVLDTACAQLALWQQNILTRHLTLSVNVSAKQFHQDDFVEQIRHILLHHAVIPPEISCD